MEEEKKTGAVWLDIKPFFNVSLSGMFATCLMQPLDTIKVRMQLGQGSALFISKKMIDKEGFSSFYKGLSAGLLRQAAYTTVRLGTFRLLINKAAEVNDGKPLPFYQKALCGLTAGAVAALVGSPADLALIRMQADAVLPLANRFNYPNAVEALYRIRADGVLRLWKGAVPTVTRVTALNLGMLASYEQSVEFCKDDLGFGHPSAVAGAVAISGLFSAACSLPFDYVKTHIQHMQPGDDGKLPYSGSLDFALKTLKDGGLSKFYTGFPVYFFRIAPHIMFSWICLNQIQRVEKSAGF